MEEIGLGKSTRGTFRGSRSKGAASAVPAYLVSPCARGVWKNARRSISGDFGSYPGGHSFDWPRSEFGPQRAVSRLNALLIPCPAATKAISAARLKTPQRTIPEKFRFGKVRVAWSM